MAWGTVSGVTVTILLPPAGPRGTRSTQVGLSHAGLAAATCWAIGLVALRRAAVAKILSHPSLLHPVSPQSVLASSSQSPRNGSQPGLAPFPRVFQRASYVSTPSFHTEDYFKVSAALGREGQ